MASSGTLDVLEAADVAAIVRAFRTALRTNQEALNRLNVYPVPDGDTGTNMALTLESTVQTMDGPGPAGSPAEADMASVCKAVSHGALMGARGNSGVIVCQILRGLTGVFQTHERVDGPTFVAALRAATTLAYEAVGRPVEGTILTVIRRSAEHAEAAATTGTSDLLGLLVAADAGAAAGLAETPSLLPVLAQAGVVDAGGAGFCLLLSAALQVVDDRPVPELDGGVGVDVLSAAQGGPRAAEKPNVAELRYEVMYLLEAPDVSIAGFKDVWAGLGDSIVVAGGGGQWNCHIHTDDIGPSIEAALDIGRPRNIRVTDLLDEVASLEEERWVREASAAGLVETEASHVQAPCATAVVAVSTGEGIRRLFLSLGVHQIVAGGQTMNPSTQQLLEAVQACPADAVVILPNNKNIIAVAEQVGALTSKSVRVVHSRSVTEGLAAAMQYDPEGPVEANAETMAAAVKGVASGEITRAVRASVCDVGPIAANDYLGIARDGGIVAVGAQLRPVATGLLAALVTGGHEIVTLIEGEGATAGDTRHIVEWLEDHHKGLSVEVHHGGQPLYPYVIGVE